MQWPLWEPMLALVDRTIPEIGDTIWNPGYAMRLGITGTPYPRTADLFYEAGKQGFKSDEVLAIVEQDDWVYDTTRYDEPAVGKSMVCCGKSSSQIPSSITKLPEARSYMHFA
jgi:hypothetical protein